MHPEDIKAALRKRGFTQAAIAHTLGVSKTAINYVIAGKTQSARVAQAIAAAAGLSVEALWPGRYVKELA